MLSGVLGFTVNAGVLLVTALWGKCQKHSERRLFFASTSCFSEEKLFLTGRKFLLSGPVIPCYNSKPPSYEVGKITADFVLREKHSSK